MNRRKRKNSIVTTGFGISDRGTWGAWVVVPFIVLKLLDLNHPSPRYCVFVCHAPLQEIFFRGKRDNGGVRKTIHISGHFVSLQVNSCSSHAWSFDTL
jgi:hypothetical protein